MLRVRDISFISYIRYHPGGLRENLGFLLGLSLLGILSRGYMGVF